MSDSKREAILNAALHVFSEKGFHPATIDEIAERAGVGKGTVYSYFRSKSELMEQLIETATGAALESAEQRLQGLRSALDQLRALADLQREHLEQREPFVRFLMADAQSAISPEFKSCMERARSHLEALVAGVIRRGQEEGAFRKEIDPHLGAILILALRAGLLHYWYSRESGPKVDSESLTRQAVEFVLHGIAASPGPSAEPAASGFGGPPPGGGA